MPVTVIDTRAALVAIDLQRGVGAAPTAPYSSKDVIAHTAEIAAAFRARGLPVVLVRVTVAPDGSDAPPGRTDLGSRGGSRPDGWDTIVDELTGHPGDITVTKRTAGAFYGTDLDLHLRRRGITQIVLTGIATSLGVESTARAAYDHGYHVVIAVDAVTDLDTEAHHHSVQRTLPRFSETAATAGILSLLPPATGSVVAH